MWSQFIRTLAAIMMDDLTSLKTITIEPNFIYHPDLLYFAGCHAAVSCFRFLAINGCPFSERALEGALHGGNEELIQLCLENGCDVHRSSAIKSTIEGFQPTVFKWLIDVHGLSVTGEDLYWAFEECNWTVFAEHLDKVADMCPASMTVGMVIKRNETVDQFVKMVIADNSLPEIFKYQLTSNPDFMYNCDDLDLLDKCGLFEETEHFVRCMAMEDCRKVLDRLRELGLIDVTESGETALTDMGDTPWISIVRPLVECGANVNYVNGQGITALAKAAALGEGTITLCLVEHGADVNLAGETNMTPLYLAAREGNEAIVKYLVEHGADVNTFTADGISPMVAALSSGHDEIARYLASHGAMKHFA